MKRKKCCNRYIRKYKKKMLEEITFEKLRPQFKYRSIRDWALSHMIIKVRRIILEKYPGDKI